jgi:hypothetical protein
MNSIRTTAIIDSDCMELLYRLSAAKKEKPSKIVELVFKEIIKLEYAGSKIRFNSSVKYQRGGGEKVMLHYSISAEVYEACLDLRKFGKKSVSKILNEGIRLLLRKIKDRIRNKVCFIEQFVEKMDNYVLIYNILRQKDARTGLITTEIHLQI